jgi:subtilisin family serine protease
MLRIMMLFLAASLVHSCGEPLNTDQIDDYPALKSAGKTSYIVVLDDERINTEISGIRGYEMKQQAMQTVASRILNRAGIADGEIGFVYTTAVQGFSVRIPPAQLYKLQNDPAVTYVEEDQIVKIVGSQPGVSASSIQATSTQTVPYGITRVKGGITYTGFGRAWIIDSGIDLDHPDLNVDVEKSRTFLGSNTTADDQNGHGTHVAGTVAAIDNGYGVIGVAAGAPVVSVRVLDRRGSGTISGVVAGVDYVAANAKDIDVANMSLGGSASSTLDAAVLKASESCKFAIAAGNDGKDANNYSPARVNGDNIFTVSAMNSSDSWASWSNFGNPPVDYCAPGVSINSTWKDGGYNTISGTSMAAPHVAGLLLLGNTTTDGWVKNDPDGNADLILVYNGLGGSSGNTAPTASFTFIKTNLKVDFKDTSTDSEGKIASWSWNFGDGATSTDQHPSHTYEAAGTYTVSLTVTDEDEATGTKSQNVTVSETTSSGITLTATGYKVKGLLNADLKWSGATESSVKIYREGKFLIEVSNSGAYTDKTNYVGGGTLIYKVCQSDDSVCSNEAAVTF